MSTAKFPMFLGNPQRPKTVRQSRFGWELTPANTGLDGAGVDKNSLPLYTGTTTPASGTVISGKRITSQLHCYNSGIVVDRCWIQPSSVGPGTPFISTINDNDNSPALGPVTISNCEIDGSLIADSISAFCAGFWGVANIYNTYFHDCASGPAIYNSGSSLSTIIEGCLVANLVAFGNPATDGNHVDGFTIRDFSDFPGRTALIRNNSFAADTITNDTGACFIQAHANIFNVTIEGNHLKGGGWNFGIEEHLPTTYGNVRVRNNRFTPDGSGTAYRTDGPGFVEWTDNYRYDADQEGGRGLVVSAP